VSRESGQSTVRLVCTRVWSLVGVVSRLLRGHVARVLSHDLVRFHRASIAQTSSRFQVHEVRLYVLANVNSRSRSLYAVARPSVVGLSVVCNSN